MSIVVITPVRNEAWILPAFLKATSLWADHIIIADQRSTDGSKEIARTFPKVTIIDNDEADMHQARTRRLLFEEVQKIKGDKIVFALDADEFLSGDFMHTEDWNKIIYSKPNSVFWFKWLQVLPGNECYTPERFFYFAAHVGEDFWEGDFPDFNIHEWRLPYPKNVDEERGVYLNDIRIMHFSHYNKTRSANKMIFYQVSSLHKNIREYTFVGLYRQYHSPSNNVIETLHEDALTFYKSNGLDIFREIDIKDYGQYYIDEILRFFRVDGLKRYKRLDIWDSDFIKNSDIKDPRNLFDKLLLCYLKKTRKYSQCVLVKAIDKILKKIGV